MIRNCPDGETLIKPADLFNGAAAMVNYGPITSTGMFLNNPPTTDDQTHGASGDTFPANQDTPVSFRYCNNERDLLTNEPVCAMCTFTVRVTPRKLIYHDFFMNKNSWYVQGIKGKK